MNNVLHVTDEISYFATPRAGSTAITGAILAKYDPEAKAMADNAVAPEGRRGMPQSVAKRVTDVSGKVVVMPVRNPVDRFASAFAIRHLLPIALRSVQTVDEMIDLVESLPPEQVNPHFRSQHLFLSYEPKEMRLYRFPGHLAEMCEALGLDETVSPDHVSEEKPNLSPEQLARVQAIYADDIALFNSITEPGQVHTVPEPPPEPSPVPESLANWRVKAVLDMQGLTTTVDAAIAALPDSPEKIVISRAWNGNGDVFRHSPTVTSFMSILSLTDAQVDDMFRLAATFNP
jgi:hypothetical protein